MAAASSEGSLALYGAGGGGTQTFAVALGPCLTVGMGEAATVAVLNSWGATRDSELIQLRLVLAAYAGELAPPTRDLGST